MKNKCNKIEDTCGTKTFATCIDYESETNEVSPLKDDCAISVEEALNDIYTQLEEINLSELGEKCLEYVETEEGRIIVKNALLKFEEEICNLKDKVEELESTALCKSSIENCSLDFGTLVDSCGNTPTTFKDTIQLILDTIQP